ncbi:MAG: DUF2812 domain-containing protein [Ruminococcaceae bacterium]|nr:DUF2812 domain-containing protein [Oscillospiraceae bacterium]
MKKQRKMSACLKKFQRDPQKQYIKRFRVYPSFMYAHLDWWLKTMSLSGWHIVHCGLFIFYFEKGAPSEKEYFTYSDPVNEGYYSIQLRHPFLEKNYGVKKKKSKINANEAKAHQIVEIDLQKIDVQKDVGYKEMVSDRNRLYLRFFIRNISMILIGLAIAFGFGKLITN